MSFNLTARLNITGPYGVKPVLDTLKKSIQNINAPVNVVISKTANTQLKELGKNLAYVDAQLKSISTSANNAAKALGNINSATAKIGTSNVNKELAQSNVILAKTASGASEAAAEIEEFGRVSGLAIRRFAGFTVATGAIFGLINAVEDATSKAIDFQKSMVTLSQVTGNSLQGVAGLEQEVTRLSVALGVSSLELIEVAKTLAQAGLTANQTKKALDALAKSSLAPSFDSMAETTEGAIAAMRQFNLESRQLESVLGSINSVSAQFAVEAEDIVAAIRRTGGVYAAAANPKDAREAEQSLREFISLFTSVRATTRESAESIATGLRTIFSRIQRRETIDSLREFNIELEKGGKFIGPYKAVEALNRELSKLDPQDIRFSKILEELGGFRQVGKVIPLILRFEDAMSALEVAEKGQTSLAEDAATAQLSLVNRMAKTREQFLALVRDMSSTDTFQTMAKSIFYLTDSLISLGGTLKPILPAIAALGSIKAISVAGNFIRGFRRGAAGINGDKSSDLLPSLSNALPTTSTATAIASKGAMSSVQVMIANTTALTQLTGAVSALTSNIIKSPIGVTRKKFASGGLVRLMSGSSESLKKPSGTSGYDYFSKVLGDKRTEEILKQYNAPTNIVGKWDTKAIRDNSKNPAGVAAYNALKAEVDSLTAKSSSSSASTDKRKRPVPVIGNSDGSPMVAGFYLRGSPNDADGKTASTKVIDRLHQSNIIPKYVKEVRVPIAHYLPNPEQSTKATDAIHSNLEHGIAQVIMALGGKPDLNLVNQATNSKGIDLSDAAGKMFEAGLSVGTGIIAEGAKTQTGKSRPMDFPELGQVQRLMKFFGNGVTTAKYGDAKLTAGQDASKKIRSQFADFLSKDANLTKEMRAIVRPQIAEYEASRPKVQKKATGGMVDVALTPGELVFGPSATASIGETALRNFNNTGVLHRNVGGDVYQVPGSGNSDSFYTQLPEGSFVIKKSSAQGYASGGRVNLFNGSKSALTKKEKAELLAKKARTRAFGEDARIIASANTYGVPTLKRAIRKNIAEPSGPFPQGYEFSEAENAQSLKRVELRNKNNPFTKDAESEQDKITRLLKARGLSEEQVASANEEYEKVLKATKGNVKKASLAAEKHAKMLELNTKESRLSKINNKLNNFTSGPGAILATIGGSMLIDQVGKGVFGNSPIGQGTTAGLAGAFSGIMTGAAVGGLPGAVIGGVAGGATSFFDAKNTAMLNKANDNVTNSMEKLDAAILNLNNDLSNTNLKAFNEAIRGVIQSSDELNAAFKEEEQGGLFATLQELEKFGSIGGMIDKITGNSKSTNSRLNIAGTELGLGGSVSLGFRGAFGLADVNKEVNDAIKARTDRQAKEIISARTPAAQASLQRLTDTAKTKAAISAGASEFNVNDFTNRIVSSLDSSTLRSLAVSNPAQFKEEFKKINALNQAADEADRLGTGKGDTIRAQAIALEEELGRKVAKNAVARTAAEAQVEQAYQSYIEYINTTTEAIAKLGQSTEILNENVDNSLNTFDNLSSMLTGGNIGSGSRSNPFTNLEVRSRAEIEAGISSVLSAAPGNKTLQTAADKVREGSIISDNLNDVLKTALARMEATGIVESPEEILKTALNDPRLAGVSQQGLSEIKALFANIAANRQVTDETQGGGLTFESVKNIVMEDANFALEARSNMTKESIVTFQKIFDTMVSGSQKIGDKLTQTSNIIQQRNAKLDQAFQISQERSLELGRMTGRDIGPGDVRNNVDNFVKRLTTRAGIGPTTDTGVIASSIVALENQIAKDIDARDKALGTSITEYNILSDAINSNSRKLSDARLALDTVATSTEELAAIQNKMAELEQRKNAGRNILERVAGARFDPRMAVELQREIQDAFKLAAGRGAGIEGGAALIEQIAAVMGPVAEDRARAAIDKSRLEAIAAPGAGRLIGLLKSVDVGAAKGEGRAEGVLIGKFIEASNKQTKALSDQASLMTRSIDVLNTNLNNTLINLTAAINGLKGRKSGGWIGGAYKGNRDTELTRLVPGEFVVRRAVAQQFGPELEALNRGVPVEAAFARGGAVLAGMRRNRGVKIDRNLRKELIRRQRDMNAMRGARGAIAVDGFAQFKDDWNNDDPKALAKLYASIRRLPNSPSARALKKIVSQGRIVERMPASFKKNERMSYIGGEIDKYARQLGIPGYADGGIVAATMPGEFVVNRSAARQNAGFLNSLNGGNIPKFANGGSVTTSRPSGGMINMSQFSSAVQALLPAIGTFAQSAMQLAKASENLKNIDIPSKITLEVAPMQVNVVLNGAEIFANMPDFVKNIVSNEINKTIKRHINPFTGETQESFMRM